MAPLNAGRRRSAVGPALDRWRRTAASELNTHRTQASEAFLAATRAVASPPSASEVVRRATREIVRALGADLGSAWRLSAVGDQLLPLASYHIPRTLDLDMFARPQPVIEGHPIVKLLRTQQRPVYATHSQGDPRFDYPLLRLLPHKSVLVQAFRVGRTMLGVLVIVWTRRSHRFRRRELGLVELVAKQTAIAVEKATLFAALRTLNDVLERLLADRTAALEQADNDLRTSHDELRALSRNLVEIREAERTRIAREIHDELGQALTGLKMEFRRADPAGRGLVTDQTGPVVQAIDGIIDSVRRIASELRPSVLDDFGLVAALDWQLRELENRTGIRTRLRCADEPTAVDPERATGVFRIVQEALTNVVRHAEATMIVVTLRIQTGSLDIEVRDNGRGMAPSVRPAQPHLGLLGMQERAATLCGKLTLRSTPGRGTTIRLRMPLAIPSASGLEGHENPRLR